MKIIKNIFLSIFALALISIGILARDEDMDYYDT